MPALIRTAILRALGERCPAGWAALVLAPPPHPERMVWHVHLRPVVTLDLADHRTIPTTPPESASDWELPNGRTATLGFGDPTPAPGADTRAIRVVGAHLSVTYEPLPAPSLVVRAGRAPGIHVYRAPAMDANQLAAPLAEGLRSAIAEGVSGAGDALGYSPTGWDAHESIWLTVHGRP